MMTAFIHNHFLVCYNGWQCPSSSKCVDGACQRGLRGTCNPLSAKICCRDEDVGK